MRVLLITDDSPLASLLRRRLWRDGHVVGMVRDGETAVNEAESSSCDAIIMDLALPDIGGATVIHHLHATGIATPILIVGVHDSLADSLHCLDAGADDYLTKPFAYEELAARMRAIARRGHMAVQEDCLVVGDLVLDRRTRAVTRKGRSLDLAPKEFALLEYLMRQSGLVVTRAVLLEHVWDFGFDPGSNVVDAAIKRLRKVVDAGDVRPLILTVRGAGYKLRDATDRP